MTIPDDEDFAEPLIVNDAPRIASRSSLKKARASESTVVWAAVALIGMAAMVYALRLARQPAPSAVEPSPVATRREAPIARPRTVTPRPRFADSQPVAERVATIPSPSERKAVDPIEGFDTGAAFDNPPSPGRYGQRTSGLLERTTLPNNNPRPNAPDPSFRSPR